MPMLSEIEETRYQILRKFDIKVNDCIALCNIVDEFEKFTENLKEFSQGIRGISNLDNLFKYIRDGKKTNKNIRDFYLENHKVLDAIHKHTYILSFLLIYFDNKTGKFSQEITQIYNYIKDNKNDKDKILAVLDKLSKLGFESVTFNQNEKFDDVYEYDKLNDREYYYLDGEIEVISSLEDFKYRSNGANYEIEFSTIPFHIPKITLNNLVFDSNLLPNNIKYDDTFKKILDLKEEKEESYKVLSDVVHFDYNLEKIMPALEKIDEIIIDIHNCQYKRHAKEYIDVAKHAILELQWVLANYEIDLVEDGLLKKETIDEEKKKYKRRNS